MAERPVLNKNLDSKTFRDYYYLKEELVDFCRKNGLPVSGGKIEITDRITDRIAYFLGTGKVLPVSKVKKKAAVLSKFEESTRIEADFVCSEKHRDFFADNQGQSLDQAIRCWKYKKQLPGHNRYERADLAAIE